MRTRYNRNLKKMKARSGEESVLTDREHYLFEKNSFLETHVHTNRPKKIRKATKRRENCPTSGDDDETDPNLLVDTQTTRGFAIRLVDVENAGFSTDIVPPSRPASTTSGSRQASIAIQDRLAIQANIVNALQKNVDNVLNRVCDPGNEWVALGGLVAATGSKLNKNLSFDFYDNITQTCCTYRRSNEPVPVQHA